MAAPSFFVMGVGRSGTSILQELLCMHPRLVVSHELRVLELVVLTAALIDADGEPRDKEPGTYTKFGLAVGGAFADALARAQIEADGKPDAIYGDKYPPYCEQIALLDRLFPSARFVHILRDGRDVVSSALQAFVADRGWRRSSSAPPVARLAFNWARNARFARDHGARLSRARYHELRYEDLVARPADELARLLAFLGVEVDASVARMAARLRPGKTWRETMSHAELADFDSVAQARELVAELGYPRSPLADGDDATSAATIARTRDVRTAEQWSELAARSRAAGDARLAAFASLRAVRDGDKRPSEAVELLADAKSASSLFASMTLRGDEGEPTRRALAAWANARGLDADAARAVFGVAR